MKKWSEIQQTALNKMFMVLTDINEDVNDYLSKMISYANEALIFIANDLRPNIREISLKYCGDFDPTKQTDVKSEKYNYYTIKDKLTFDGEELTHKDFIYSDGKNWIISKNNLIFKMPDDFISYADISHTFNPNSFTKNRFLKFEKDTPVVYIGRDKLVLPKLGDYKLYYYALYGEIPLDLATTDSDRDLTLDYYQDGELVFTGIPQSVLNTLPSYIASQLQAQDDPQRSTILRNEFELMCSRLDTTNYYNIESFISEGGWV